MELVIAVENAGPMVISSTCDQGGANIGLFTTLNVTPEEPWIPNPNDPNRKLFMSNDWVHVLKNFRNNYYKRIKFINFAKILMNVINLKIYNLIE